MVKEKIKNETLEVIIQHNTEIIKNSCCAKKLKYAELKTHAIIWKNIEDFVKETKENCPTLESTFYCFDGGKVIVLLDSKKISQLDSRKISQ